jgi:hypothetical protein
MLECLSGQKENVEAEGNCGAEGANRTPDADQMKFTPSENRRSRHIDRNHCEPLREGKAVKGKQETGHTCGKGPAKEDNSPFFDQLSGKQSEQDPGPCPNRNQTAGDMDEREDIHNHVFTSSIHL